MDVFAGSVLLPNCLCCSCTFQLPAIHLLLPAANEQPGGKATRIESSLMDFTIFVGAITAGRGLVVIHRTHFEEVSKEPWLANFTPCNGMNE